jgi:uracil phosphoribosyltransferase
MVFNLCAQSSLAQVYLKELRDIHIQKDRARFRRNLERLGQILAYEISKSMRFRLETVTTPLDTADISIPDEQPVLCSILRAGVPFFNGFVSYFDHADCAFVGAYRGKNRKDLSFDIELDYVAAPDLEGKCLILIDPMLATGKSIVKAYEALLKWGEPASLHVASVIAAPEGVDWIESRLPQADIWTGAIDRELNRHSYIVPGLGDAGDLAFGPKIDC